MAVKVGRSMNIWEGVDGNVGRGVGIHEDAGGSHIWRNLKKSSSLVSLDFSTMWSEGASNYLI